MSTPQTSGEAWAGKAGRLEGTIKTLIFAIEASTTDADRERALAKARQRLVVIDLEHEQDLERLAKRLVEAS